MVLILSSVSLMSGCGIADLARALAGKYESPAEETHSESTPYESGAESAKPFAETEPESITDTDGNGITVTTDVSDGFASVGGVYTFSKGGEYILSGSSSTALIRVETEEEITLVLSGLYIVSDKDVPISVKAGKCTVKAEEGTENTVKDSRSPVENAEGGAITADCDLTVGGSGVLNVISSYNNGIHTKKDLTVKKLTLNVSAPNNALKGADSVTVKSGVITLISTDGDGIKTEHSDISSKGNQRGNVILEGGSTDIYSARDGIDASFGFEMKEGASLKIHTNSRSAHTSEVLGNQSGRGGRGGFGGGFGGFGGGGFGEKSGTNYASSCKGIKAGDHVTLEGGTAEIYSDDDGIHANGGEELENGEKSAGNVTVSGGTLHIQTNDDGIHADGTLTVSGGTIEIPESHEGIEGCVISITGGVTAVIADDDGVNAAGSLLSQKITVSGGVLDVTVGSGDVDGIDSNGTFTQTGGLVISRAEVTDTSGNMGALDTDGACVFEGGTFICLGTSAKNPGTSDPKVNWVSFGTVIEGRGGPGGFGGGGFGRPGQKSSSRVSIPSGDYVLKSSDGKEILSFSLAASYGSLWIMSDSLSVGEEYTLSSKDFTKSWKQSAKYVKAE